MTTKEVYQCKCENCKKSEYHPDQQIHHGMNLFLSRLNEQQRRWYVALEAQKLGHGGRKQMSIITGMNVNTIRKGRREMEADLTTRPHDRIRIKGGGRKLVEKKA